MSIIPAEGVISFARGVPSPDMFPYAQLAESARRAVEVHGRTALNYGPPAGFGPLREWVAERHGVAPGQVLLTPGSMIGLNLLVGALVGPGGVAAVESPTYDRVLASLAAAGASAVTVARGDDGLDLDRLRALLAGPQRPSLLYVLPTFHNPSGRTLTLAQRRELVALAVEHDLLLLEDDPYGLLRVEGERPPYLHELLHEAGAGHLAILASSFSKSVAPGLRVGYLVLPEHHVAALESAALRTYVSPPLLPQAQLYDFLAAGHLEPHLEQACAFLRVRRDALLSGLAEGMPDGITWTHPEGGYFLWLMLREGADATALAAEARTTGVEIVPGAGFHADGTGANTARLAFSFPTVAEIEEGARRLCSLVRRTTP